MNCGTEWNEDIITAKNISSFFFRSSYMIFFIYPFTITFILSRVDVNSQLTPPERTWFFVGRASRWQRVTGRLFLFRSKPGSVFFLFQALSANVILVLTTARMNCLFLILNTTVGKYSVNKHETFLFCIKYY